jgi:hypothetical protein
MVYLTGKFHKVLILVRIVSKSKLVQLKLRLSLCSPFGFLHYRGSKNPTFFTPEFGKKGHPRRDDRCSYLLKLFSLFVALTPPAI